jgi:hypothetical protein
MKKDDVCPTSRTPRVKMDLIGISAKTGKTSLTARAVKFGKRASLLSFTESNQAPF